MSERSQGRVAVVTGGASGIGRAIALALAEQGDWVTVVDIRDSSSDGEDATHRVIARQGGNATFQRADVGASDDVERVFGAVSEQHGPVDVLVNSAGAFPTIERSIDLPLDDWERIVRTNLTGTWLCCRVALRTMVDRGAGKIVNIGSRLGLTGGGTGRAAYCASKGGVSNLTRQLAVEYGPNGVNVNCVCPGFVPDTGNQITQLPGRRQQAEERTPYPRLGTVDDVTAAVLYLTSTSSDWVNGHNLVVDGGALVMP